MHSSSPTRKFFLGNLMYNMSLIFYLYDHHGLLLPSRFPSVSSADHCYQSQSFCPSLETAVCYRYKPLFAAVLRYSPSFAAVHCFPSQSNLSLQPRSLHSVPQRDLCGFSIFPANESLRRTCLHLSFGKIQFLPPCIWDLPFMSYRLCLLLSIALNYCVLSLSAIVRCCLPLSSLSTAFHPSQSIPVHHSPSLSIAAHQCLLLSITVHRFPMLSCVHG